jgi:hypothetical protein
LFVRFLPTFGISQLLQIIAFCEQWIDFPLRNPLFLEDPPGQQTNENKPPFSPYKLMDLLPDPLFQWAVSVNPIVLYVLQRQMDLLDIVTQHNKIRIKWDGRFLKIVAVP